MKLYLLFFTFTPALLFSQSVSYETQIHKSVTSSGDFEQLNVIQGESEYYILLQSQENTIEQDNNVKIGEESIVKNSPSLILTKLDASNSLTDFIALSVSGKEDNMFQPEFSSHNIYYADEHVYLFGSVRFTDSLFVNGSLYKLIDENETFIFKLDDEFAIIEEYYFGKGQVTCEIPFLLVDNDRLFISGKFQDKFSDSLDYSIVIFGDTLSNIDTNYPTESLFFLEHDMIADSTLRSFTFGGEFYNILYDMQMDQEGNIYIACDEGAGSFSVLGTDVEQNIFAADNAVSFSFDQDNNLNYSTHYESYKNDNDVQFHLLNDDLIESVYSGAGDTLYINDDFIYLGPPGSGTSLMLKRNSNGETQWISRLSTLSTNNSIRTIAKMDDGDILVGCRVRSDEVYYNEAFMFENSGFSDVLLMQINETTGELKEFYNFGSTPQDLNNDIHNIFSLGNNKYKIFLTIGEWYSPGNGGYVEIFGENIEPLAQSALLVIDVDFSATNSENLQEPEFRILNNPLRNGEIINCNYEEKVLLIDQLGRIRWKGYCGEIIQGLNYGVYYIMTTNSNKCLGKIVVIE